MPKKQKIMNFLDRDLVKIMLNGIINCPFYKTAYLYTLNSIKTVFLDVYDIHDIYLLNEYYKYEYAG